MITPTVLLRTIRSSFRRRRELPGRYDLKNVESGAVAEGVLLWDLAGVNSWDETLTVKIEEVPYYGGSALKLTINVPSMMSQGPVLAAILTRTGS